MIKKPTFDLKQKKYNNKSQHYEIYQKIQHYKMLAFFVIFQNVGFFCSISKCWLSLLYFKMLAFFVIFQNIGFYYYIV